MKLLMAATVLALVSGMGAATASDIGVIPTSGGMSVPISGESGFDWSGFYAGVYGGVHRNADGEVRPALGFDLGVNSRFEFYLLGGEVAVHGIAGADAGTSGYGQILGRAGLIVSDNVAVYAAGGYGINLGTPAEQDVLLGGGVEIAVSDRVSVRAQYLHGFSVEGSSPGDQVTFGASYHF